MDLCQVLAGGKGPDIIAGQQGVVYAIQMGGNDGGVRRFSADRFHIGQAHNQPANRYCRLATVEDDHIWSEGFNNLLHAVKIHGVSGKIQRFSLALQHIAAALPHTNYGFWGISMPGGNFCDDDVSHPDFRRCKCCDIPKAHVCDQFFIRIILH